MNKETFRTFHWNDEVSTKRSVAINDVGNITIIYSPTMTMDMSPEQFDDLIQYVYSERKKRQFHKEEHNANS